MGRWWSAQSARNRGVIVLVALIAIYVVASPRATVAPATASGTPAISTAAAAAAASTASAVVAATAAATSAPTTAPTPVPTAPPTIARTATPTPPPTAFNFGTGKKLVPSEVPAGTYRTRTAAAACYWERLSGLGGTIGEILANGNTDAPEVVTVLAADKAFNSSRCAPWTVDLSAITKSPTDPFGAGTYIVGVDIAAGTWRSSGGSSCYWQRMRGFTGTFSEIIANENSTVSTIIAIGASDKGFSSTRCGTWTKIG